MKLIAKTFHGLEKVLATELEQLGADDIKIVNRAVEFDGDNALMYKANLHLRTAIRILKPIYSFSAQNEDELYEGVKKHNWMQYMDNDQTLAIDSVVYSEIFTHSKYVALKTKDAIVDQFRDSTGARPSIDVENPDLRVVIHVAKDKITMSLDSSSESLHKRGYRIQGHKAPINEVLAAGMVMLSGWDPKVALVDPMCGSGTILMEAVMYARNMAPGIKRSDYGFMHWKDYEPETWKTIYEDAKKQIINPRLYIYGSDIAVSAIDIARQSALNFDLKQYITFNVSDFSRIDIERSNGVIITNPPYGERLSKGKDMSEFYFKLGSKIKNTFSEYDAWILSSNKDALKDMDLEPIEQLKLFNGALECQYNKYNFYQGTIKKIKRFR